MGWFLNPEQPTHWLKNFRPRLGMGWFERQERTRPLCIYIFVPEWGWVGSTEPVAPVPVVSLFSSPSGDGLVLNTEKMTKVLRSFCPRLGMGWFYTYAITIQQTGVFVPEWGWVGSLEDVQVRLASTNFRPRLGWVDSKGF